MTYKEQLPLETLLCLLLLLLLIVAGGLIDQILWALKTNIEDRLAD